MTFGAKLDASVRQLGVPRLEEGIELSPDGPHDLGVIVSVFSVQLDLLDLQQSLKL